MVTTAESLLPVCSALHTGREVRNGTFPFCAGTWGGTTLSAAGDSVGPCDGGTLWGEAWLWDPGEAFSGVDDPEGYLDDGVTTDDGPARVTFGLDLVASPALPSPPETGGAGFPVQDLLVGLGGPKVAAGLGSHGHSPAQAERTWVAAGTSDLVSLRFGGTEASRLASPPAPGHCRRGLWSMCRAAGGDGAAAQAAPQQSARLLLAEYSRQITARWVCP